MSERSFWAAIANERTEDLTKTIEDGYHYRIKICGPEREVLASLEKLRGVKSVSATGERDADSYAYLVESERGVDVRKPIFALCAQKNWPIIGMMPVGTDLESIFIRLVDRSDNEGAKPDGKRRRAH